MNIGIQTWLKYFLFSVYFTITAFPNLFTNEQRQVLHDVSTLFQTDVPRSLHLGNNVKRRYRILCFGDSLTQGYYGIRNHYHPYSKMLKKLLVKNYGDNFDIITAGVGGERVHKEMYYRLKHFLKETTFDLILILGGVNDLATLDCIHNVDLFHDIWLLHSFAHSQSIRTVVMTILDAHIAENKLLVLNERQFASVKNNVNKKLRVINSTLSVLCDTASEFPLDNLPNAMKELTWTKDNVHPTPYGYDELGRVIFECIDTNIDLPT